MMYCIQGNAPELLKAEKVCMLAAVLAGVGIPKLRDLTTSHVQQET